MSCSEVLAALFWLAVVVLYNASKPLIVTTTTNKTYNDTDKSHSLSGQNNTLTTAFTVSRSSTTTMTTTPSELIFTTNSTTGHPKSPKPFVTPPTDFTTYAVVGDELQHRTSATEPVHAHTVAPTILPPGIPPYVVVRIPVLQPATATLASPVDRESQTPRRTEFRARKRPYALAGSHPELSRVRVEIPDTIEFEQSPAETDTVKSVPVSSRNYIPPMFRAENVGQARSSLRKSVGRDPSSKKLKESRPPPPWIRDSEAGVKYFMHSNLERADSLRNRPPVNNGRQHVQLADARPSFGDTRQPSPTRSGWIKVKGDESLEFLRRRPPPSPQRRQPPSWQPPSLEPIGTSGSQPRPNSLSNAAVGEEKANGRDKAHSRTQVEQPTKATNSRPAYKHFASKQLPDIASKEEDDNIQLLPTMQMTAEQARARGYLSPEEYDNNRREADNGVTEASSSVLEPSTEQPNTDHGGGGNQRIAVSSTQPNIADTVEHRTDLDRQQAESENNSEKPPEADPTVEVMSPLVVHLR